MLRKNGVILRALHQMQEAKAREPGAAVCSNRSDDFSGPSDDQNVGDSVRDGLSFGDGKQMLLAFTSCIGDQSFDFQPLRGPEHRPRDVDRIVKSKFVDYTERRVVAGSKLGRQPNSRVELNFLREPPYDLAEGPNLIFGIPSGDQNVRGVPQ